VVVTRRSRKHYFKLHIAGRRLEKAGAARRANGAKIAHELLKVHGSATEQSAEASPISRPSSDYALDVESRHVVRR
jgi:hypothetical protein